MDMTFRWCLSSNCNQRHQLFPFCNRRRRRQDFLESAIAEKKSDVFLVFTKVFLHSDDSPPERSLVFGHRWSDLGVHNMRGVS